MSVVRCHVEPGAWRNDEMALGEAESHHLVVVLRAKEGQPIVVFDGRGRVAECELAAPDRKVARVRVMMQREEPRPSVELVLVQGLPREQKLDLVVQKSVELGVSRIHPVQTDFAVMRVRGDNEQSKMDRWQKIALNAAKQCGAAWIPDIEPVQALQPALASMPPVDALLVCSLEPDAIPLHAAVAQIRDLAPKRIAAIVGPEGDLSAAERAAARSAGGRAISLGMHTLRSETASLFVLSVLAYEFLNGKR